MIKNDVLQNQNGMKTLNNTMACFCDVLLLPFGSPDQFYIKPNTQFCSIK